MANVQRELQRRSGTTAADLILEVIGSLNVVDYGIIVNVYERGEAGGEAGGVYADVRLLDGSFITNAEVLFPGCRSASIDAAPAPCDRCLVLGAKRNIAGVDATLSSPAPIYSAETVKALPLGSPAAPSRLLLGNGASLHHKNGSIGVDGLGSVFSRSVDEGGHTTRDEEYRPDGSLRKAYNGMKAVEERGADYSNEWTLYDDENKIIEYERRDMEGALSRLEGEITGVDAGFAEKKWLYEKAKSVKGGWTETRTIKDADGKTLRKRAFNIDGSEELFLYEQSEGGGDFLITRKTLPDGSFQWTLTDGADAICAVSIGADGAAKVDVGGGEAVLELNPDGSARLALEDGLALSTAGDVKVEGGGSITFKSTKSGKLAIGNSIATLGAMVKDLLSALQGFHSEGSPGAHTAAAWHAASVQPIALKWNQVFD